MSKEEGMIQAYTATSNTMPMTNAVDATTTKPHATVKVEVCRERDKDAVTLTAYPTKKWCALGLDTEGKLCLLEWNDDETPTIAPMEETNDTD